MGAGEKHLPGYINVDIKSGDEAVNLGVFPWPFKDNSADVIMASHILEHFPKAMGKQFLAECYRMLKPGGLLHVAVPDMDIFIDCKLSGDWSPVGDYAWRDFNWMFGGDTGETVLEMRHYYMYNEETLAAMMGAAGFKPQGRRNPLPEDNERYHLISLYVTGLK